MERFQWKPKLNALKRFNKGVTKENCSQINCGDDLKVREKIIKIRWILCCLLNFLVFTVLHGDGRLHITSVVFARKTVL